MLLDMRTLILLNLLGNVIGLVTLAILWLQFRGRYRGIGFWLTDYALQTLAIVLIVLRGAIPDFVSMTVANVCAQVGILLLLIGLQQFLGIPGRHRFNLVFLVVFTLAFSWFSVATPDLRIRDILLCASMTLFMGQIAWFLLLRTSNPGTRFTLMPGIVALGLVVANLVRLVVLLSQPLPSNDFFRAGNGEGVALLVYVTLSLFMAFSLVLLVSRRLADDVRSEEEKFTKAFHGAPYAVLLTRAEDGTIFEANLGFEEITGFPRPEVLQKTTPEIGIWTSEEARTSFLQKLFLERHVRNFEHEFRRKDGSLLVGQISAEFIQIGGEECVISCIGDVTAESRLRDQLKDLATHDALTGLPNRRLFSDRFEVALSNALRGKKKLAVMSLDLDKFKEINDGHGHETGDLVLIEAARRLTGCLRRVDTVARFGGDEFVLLLWEVEEPGDASRIALKILEQFRVPFSVQGKSLILHSSIGIALYPDDGADLKTLLRKSDEALYAVKAHGRNHYRFPVLEPTTPTS